MNPVAIIFDNFGPYHLARLRAAAATCDLLAIEVAGRSATYAWDATRGTEPFRRETLLEAGTSAGVPRGEIGRRLVAALERFNPAVVVVPGWASPAAWAAMQWCAQRRVAMAVMSESTAWDEPAAAWKRALKRRLIRRFSAALVGGRHHADNLTPLGLARERIFFGYDAVDNAYFSSNAGTARAHADETRRQLALPENYFLASARFVEKKNLARLLEAFAQYRARGGEWSLVLLGDGPLRPALEQQCDDLGLHDLVLMPGFRQYGELPAYYALAGAFIHASTIEPWGLVVNEAAASGLPLLVSNRCGCAPELVRDGVNGFTFDPANAGALTALMEKIAAPNFDRTAFAAASREIVAPWGPERFARGLTQAVETALAKAPPLPGALDRALFSFLARR
ncbi:MAG TPA: glycosyltransferase [Candidatus Methylacidiphilales bacterium]|jgi:glycosyltransferase involved in cell wall biosynthesis|nr:glycosyltransferase [Candidatus Methylacidiphilales bacterium]